MTTKKSKETPRTKKALVSRHSSEMRAPKNYIIAGPDAKVWTAAMNRAKAEGRSMRWVIMELLRLYGENGIAA